MGIKTLIADVTCVTTDIGACAVTSAKLGECAVESDRIAKSVGQWIGKNIPAMTAAGTAWFTFTVTAACVAIDAILVITAGFSDDRSVEVKETASGDKLIESCTLTAAGVFRSLNVIASVANSAIAEVQHTNVVEIAAGKSIEGVLTASLTITAQGTFYVCVIEKPS